MAYYITDACTKCAACLFECPTSSIIEGADQYIIDPDTCGDIQSCVAVCPVDAIYKVGTKPPAKKDSNPYTPTQ